MYLKQGVVFSWALLTKKRTLLHFVQKYKKNSFFDLSKTLILQNGAKESKEDALPNLSTVYVMNVLSLTSLKNVHKRAYMM